MSGPSRRERTRPAELLGLAAAVGIGIGLVVLFAIRDLVLAGVFGGVAFIVSLVVFAMLLLAASPPPPREHDPEDPPAH